MRSTSTTSNLPAAARAAVTEGTEVHLRVATGAVLVLCLLAAAGPLAAARVPLRTGSTVLHGRYVTVVTEAGASPTRAATIESEVDGLNATIGGDFRYTPVPLQVWLYATHQSFARALWAVQRQHPQSSTDDAGTIVQGRLLLGPLPTRYLRHNLAHLYTEWIVDALTDNRSDSLPPETWMYDGLAEYEAYRHAAAGMRCDARAAAPFAITAVRSARQWMALRSGPLGSLEYCLAYGRVRTLVNREGWAAVVEELHRRESWPAAARVLERNASIGG